MPRPKRLILPFVPHHITQRGNNQRVVFHSDDDRLRYLYLLSKYSKRENLKILAYCLMTNHIHIVAIPEKEKTIPDVIRMLQSQYSSITNQINGNTGHIWQQHYHSCPLDDKHLVATLRYVEQNPVRAGITESPYNFKWSSTGAHQSGSDAFFILDLKWWFERFDKNSWDEFLSENLDKDTLALIRFQTRTGRSS
jgi:putative transposase